MNGRSTQYFLPKCKFDEYSFCFTHFLQLYLGLTPSLATAFFRGVPGLKSADFVPYVNFVISSSVLARDAAKGLEIVNALEVATTKIRKSDAIEVSLVIVCKYYVESDA